MRIDLHTHFYPKEFFELVEAADSDFSFGVGVTGMRYIAYQGARFFGITEPMSSMQLRLDAMDGAGVDIAVISMGPLAQFIKDKHQQEQMSIRLNDIYAQLMTDHPTRIRGYATVPLIDNDAAIKETNRALDELRFSGVIVPSNVRGMYYDDPFFAPFLEEANRLGLTLFMHPLVPPGNESLRSYVLGPIVGFMFDTTVSVAKLAYSGTLAKYPNIKWHIAHAGGAVPWLLERIDNGYRDYDENKQHIDALPSSYIKQLYFDTVTFSQHTLRMLRDIVGTDHMVLGTDFPHPLGGIDKGVKSIEAMQVPDHEKADIFEHTARKLLKNL